MAEGSRLRCNGRMLAWRRSQMINLREATAGMACDFICYDSRIFFSLAYHLFLWRSRINRSKQLSQWVQHGIGESWQDTSRGSTSSIERNFCQVHTKVDEEDCYSFVQIHLFLFSTTLDMDMVAHTTTLQTLQSRQWEFTSFQHQGSPLHDRPS